MIPPVDPPETIRFSIWGMTCGSCVNRIVRAVRRLDGVTNVTVDLGRETATVRRERALVSDAALAAAIADAGYKADLFGALVVADEPERTLLARLLRR